MGEWGLMILALLLMSFATVFMMRRETALAGFGSVSVPGNNSIPFNSNVFKNLLGYVMLGLALTFAVAVLFFGYEMTNADIPGSLIAAPILAYLIHLMIGFRNEK